MKVGALVLIGLERLKAEEVVAVFSGVIDAAPLVVAAGVNEKVKSDEFAVLLLAPPRENSGSEAVDVVIVVASDFRVKSKNVEDAVVDAVLVFAVKLIKGIDFAGVSTDDAVSAGAVVAVEVSGKRVLDCVLLTLAEKLNTGGVTIEPTVDVEDTGLVGKLNTGLAVVPVRTPAKLKPG